MKARTVSDGRSLDPSVSGPRLGAARYRGSLGPSAEIGGRADSQWVKAAGGLADGIRTGRFAPGERLPTVTDMAAAACVHPRVMTRALLRLRELGYVDYRIGYGYYVSEEPPDFV